MLYDWLDVEKLTEHERFAEHSREVFDAVLDLAADLATLNFAPHNRLSDLNEPTFDGAHVAVIPEVAQALQAYGRSGLLGSAMDEAVGGGQLPQVVGRACFTWLQAANSATAAYPLLTMGNANLLATFGTPQQIEQFVRPMVEGRFFGTMCLSESQAGSSLGDVTTRAVPQPDGTFRLFGDKMWISGGDHEMSENILHLVLARVEGAPAGVRGLSLFLVPRILLGEDGSPGQRNDVIATGLNHKMGYRGTVNAVLAFGSGSHLPDGEPGAIGQLVGELGHGLDHMFHMMNEARVAVGASAVGLGYTSYLHALAYARARSQGRLPGHKDPRTPQVALIVHPDVRRMLLASKSYVEGGLALVLYAAKLLDLKAIADDEEEAARLDLLLGVLTPIVKAWPSQWCRKANDLSIQIHGGAGYTRDFPVEQFYRDARLNPIHEGTDGIQALDLLVRKLATPTLTELEVLRASCQATIDKTPEELSAFAGQLGGAVDLLVGVTQRLRDAGDPLLLAAQATAFADAAGHIVVAWMWLEQMIAAQRGANRIHEGKRLAGRYFFAYELPMAVRTLDLVDDHDRIVVDLDDNFL
ncbi:acyl-CoA dehydrogenase [Angustibacter luteus]